jgi:hypothetical protein
MESILAAAGGICQDNCPNCKYICDGRAAHSEDRGAAHSVELAGPASAMKAAQAATAGIDRRAANDPQHSTGVLTQPNRRGGYNYPAHHLSAPDATERT